MARFTRDTRDLWLDHAKAVLTSDERADLAATPDGERRVEHAIGRALMRLVGTRVSGQPPRRLEINLSEMGKPSLPGVPNLHISIAHTKNAVVVADSRGVPVGVDMESSETLSTSRELIERLFSDDERTTARGLRDDELRGWFTKAWTVKEAVGKALGVGVVPSLRGTIVSGLTPLTLRSVCGGPPADSWTIHQLDAPDGDERIAVALPARAVPLGSVSTITLSAFARRIGSVGAVPHE